MKTLKTEITKKITQLERLAPLKTSLNMCFNGAIMLCGLFEFVSALMLVWSDNNAVIFKAALTALVVGVCLFGAKKFCAGFIDEMFADQSKVVFSDIQTITDRPAAAKRPPFNQGPDKDKAITEIFKIMQQNDVNREEAIGFVHRVITQTGEHPDYLLFMLATPCEHQLTPQIAMKYEEQILQHIKDKKHPHDCAEFITDIERAGQSKN